MQKLKEKEEYEKQIKIKQEFTQYFFYDFKNFGKILYFSETIIIQ